MQQVAFILKLLTDKHYTCSWKFLCHIFKSCAIFYKSNWQKTLELQRIALIKKEKHYKELLL